MTDISGTLGGEFDALRFGLNLLFGIGIGVLAAWLLPRDEAGHDTQGGRHECAGCYFFRVTCLMELDVFKGMKKTIEGSHCWT